MFRSINRFLKNTRGAFAMQFALLAIPLTVCTGLAIDGGRAFLARFELASALDAAALAVGSTLHEGADLDAIAAKFVNRNFRTEHDEPISLELVPGEETIVLKGSVVINTYFMPLIGQPTVTVSAESEVRRGGSNVEVAMALDITGSMNATRMTGLTDAAKILIDEVVNPVQTPFFSKVAIVPWSQSVNVGSTHVTATATDFRGTVTGTTPISGATWRAPSTTTKSITEIGWRTNTGRSISAMSWRRGAALNITDIRKTNSNARIRLTVSAGSSTYYANGDTIYISGANGSYTGLNGNRYTVADRTNTSPYYIWLYNLGTTTYTTPPAGTTNGTAGTTQRCWTTACEVGVTTSSNHGFAANDLIYINGVNTTGGGTSPNNTWGTTYTIGAFDSTTFILPGTNSSSFATYNNSGTASECYVSDCRYRVTTSASHSFLTTDNVFIWGVSETGSGTSVNTGVNTHTTIASPSGSVFFMPGEGRSYMDPTSTGSAAECALTTCNIQVTSVGHQFAVNDRVDLKSIGGMSGLNNCSLSTSGTCSSGTRLTWEISAISGNVLTLKDSSPSLSNVSSGYTSGTGTAQCTHYGCNRMFFTTSGGAERLYRPSTCMVERYGDDAYNDADPADSPLGILYTGDGTCDVDNYITPLTSNKDRLNASIDALSTGGSTAGQLGVAWGWYMLSPNFAGIWDKEAENVPKSYTASELAKVLILMTDGEFNYATCNGVSSGTINSSICSPDDADDNTAGKHVAFKQAEAICDAMKEQDIIIYTVGLQLNTALYADDFLLDCATSPQHAFLADDNDELEEAFKDIAISISKLRIAR